MSDFVFIGSGGSRAAATLRQRADGLVAALGYKAQGVRTFQSAAGNMAAMQFSRATNLYSESEQFHVHESGAVTLVKGHVIRKSGEQANVLSAADLAEIVRRSGWRNVRTSLTGDYGVCNFDNDGARFFSDPLSIVSIFYHVAEDGSCVVATRPRLIKELVPDCGFDYRSLAWQAVAYWPLGCGTLLNGVRRVPQAGTLEWGPGGPRVTERPLFYLNNPGTRELADALQREPDVVLDRVISGMGASLQAILSKASAPTLAITGGRDSRAIAALATMGESSIENLEFFTNGVSDHPDVIVGRRIAEIVGASFTNRVPGKSSYSSREIMRQRLGAIFRYDGMLPIWDGGGDVGTSSKVLLQGHVGEIYRDKWFRSTYSSPQDFARRMFGEANVDPNRLLRPDVAIDFERQLAERASYYIDHGARCDQIGGVFRVEGMQSWESSQFSQGALWASHPVHPLYDPEMIDVSFAARSEWRDDERIHYEIIRRSRVNLVDVPFAGYAWHRGLEANAGCRAVDVEPIKNSRSLVSAGGWQAALFFSSPLQRRFLEIVEDCGSSPLWEYFDKEKFVSSVRGATADMGSMHMTRIYSLLTSLCYSRGYEIPVKFGAAAPEAGLEVRTVLRSALEGSVLYDGNKSAARLHEVESQGAVLPEAEVPNGVVSLLLESPATDATEADLYELYAQLRQERTERIRLERLLQKAERDAKTSG